MPDTENEFEFIKAAADHAGVPYDVKTTAFSVSFIIDIMKGLWSKEEEAYKRGYEDGANNVRKLHE